MTCRCCNPGLPVCLTLLHCSCCTFHIRQDDKQWLSLSCCETIWSVLWRYNMDAFKFQLSNTPYLHVFYWPFFEMMSGARTGTPEGVKEEWKDELHLDLFEITACLISFFLLSFLLEVNIQYSGCKPPAASYLPGVSYSSSKRSSVGLLLKLAAEILVHNTPASWARDLLTNKNLFLVRSTKKIRSMWAHIVSMNYLLQFKRF